MNESHNDQIRTQVRQTYSKVAIAPAACGCTPSSCCGTGTQPASISAQTLGYSQQDAESVPDGANMGLGCGNPQAIAALTLGEVVLDLGSGGGFDCFLAARQVGSSGRVIGIDMTPEMVSKARANAVSAGCTNVEFRLGEIENLPVADNTANVIISNCVINLSPDKPRVFAEAFRVLKPGGRLAISDVVATAELPDSIKQDMALYSGCMAGASLVSELEASLLAAGFAQIRITPKEESRAFIRDWAPGSGAENYVVSAEIAAIKPA
ncbi:MAG: arsenite S-adenosylmethyltransferase [Burkholderiaceae bacterium]|nr:arsenite S-adenosylmethyltransferase [Burkholderiaceae bacterium]